MSQKQSFLWERILEVSSTLKGTKDALEKWEKQMLLKVLLRQLKDDMSEMEFKKLLSKNRSKLVSH
jgi:hypothetical protein